MRYTLENTRQAVLTPSVGTTSLKPTVGRGPAGPNTIPTNEAIAAAVAADGPARDALLASYVSVPRLPVLYASQYGVVADESTQASANAARIQDAIDDLTSAFSGGGTIRLPQGVTYIASTLVVPVDRHIQIEGAGPSHTGGTRWGSVLRRASGFTGELISAVGTSDSSGTRAILALVGFGLHGNGAGSLPLLRVARASECVLDDLRFSNTQGEALVLTNVWNSYYSRLTFNSSGSPSAAAVRIDAPAGEDSSNGNFWTQCQWENNNGVSLRITGSVNWSLVNFFVNCKFEDSVVGSPSWPLVHLAQSAATTFAECWFMKGRRSNNNRATGPLILQDGTVPTNDGERRANLITGSHLSYWGDPEALVDHQTGSLIITSNDFTGIPTAAYIKRATTLGVNESVVADNRYEHPKFGLYPVRGIAATGKVGQWQSASNMVSVAAAALSGTSGQATFSYIDLARGATIEALGVHVTTAAVGGSSPALQVGLFKDDGSGAYPGELIMDGGSITPTTLGSQAGAAISLELPPGRYWIGVKWTFSTVPTTLPQVSMISSAAPPLPGSNLGNNYRGFATTGQAAGAWSGSAPAGMSPQGTTAVINAGVKIA